MPASLSDLMKRGFIGPKKGRTGGKHGVSVGLVEPFCRFQLKKKRIKGFAESGAGGGRGAFDEKEMKRRGTR